MNLNNIYEDSLFTEYDSNELDTNYINDLNANELSSVFQRDARRYPHSLEVSI